MWLANRWHNITCIFSCLHVVVYTCRVVVVCFVSFVFLMCLSHISTCLPRGYHIMIHSPSMASTGDL